MSWIAVGVGGASATANYLNNQAAKKREAANMQANAEAIRYSPWSGMKPQFQSKSAGTSDIGSLLTGGLQGAMFASQFGKKAPGAPAQTADTSDADLEKAGGFAPGTFGLQRQNQALENGMVSAQDPRKKNLYGNSPT